MKIIPLSIPTPLYVGDVNVYLIKEDPLTLIDCGPKTPEAIFVLKDKLKAHGVLFSDIERIVLTHAHEDHCGLAQTIRDEAKNARVLVHGWETGHLFGRLESEENEKLLRRAGVPEEAFRRMHGFYDGFRGMTDALKEGEFDLLQDEMEIGFANGVLKVLHTPGHTPGSCSFLREANRTLICGDCVLKRITPFPMLAADPIDPRRRFRALAEYLVSLAKLRATAPTLTYGGHGEPVTDFEEIFNRYIRAINGRQQKVVSSVSKNGSTGFEVAEKVFREAIDDDAQRFLALSETIAHLDYAWNEGRIEVEIKEGIEYFRKL